LIDNSKGFEFRNVELVESVVVLIVEIVSLS